MNALLKNFCFTFLMIMIVSAGQLYADNSEGSTSILDLKSSVEELITMVDNAKKSIVQVIVYDSSGKAGSASGFFTGTEGRIITNASILENAYSAEIFSDNRHYENVMVLNKDNGVDIALLQVASVNEEALELADGYEVKNGRKVIIVGRTDDFASTVSEGLISDVIKQDDSNLFFEIGTTGRLLRYRYSEDGPVINMNGKVIGIAVNKVTGFNGMQMNRVYFEDKLTAVGAGAIRTLLKGPYKTERLRSPGERVWLHWFLRQVREYAESSFVVLYDLGFNVILSSIVASALLVLLLIWLLNNAGKKIKRRSGR